MEKGNLKVGLRDERGFTLTQDYGFTVEEDTRVLAFDKFNHPELGSLLLFGDQVFSLKYWKEEELRKGIELLQVSLVEELERRRNGIE